MKFYDFKNDCEYPLDVETAEKFVRETRDLIIKITRWYMKNWSDLPDHKHRQYVNLIPKLKRRHNKFCAMCGMEMLI